MLEEFCHDYGVLSSFARHYQTGEVLPRELFARMNRADAYGRASGQLDKAIALDFFAQFDARNLLGGPAGMRYRQAVLAPGSTRPAAELARDFLGREPNLDAYRRWMLAEFDAEAKSSSAAR